MASIFVGAVLFGSSIFFLLLVTQKGWFQPKLSFYTLLESGDGVRIGSPVEMVGVRIGAVEKIELDDQNQIRTHLRILRKFKDRIREDSRIQLSRPFLVGEKVLHLSPGSASKARLPEGAVIASTESMGVMDLLNGRKLAPYFETMELAAAEMKKLVDMLLKERSSEKMVSSITNLPKMLKNVTTAAAELSKVSRQMSKEQHLGTLVANLAVTTDQMRAHSPEMGKDLGAMVANMSLLSEEFKKVVPALALIAPDLPRSSQRLVQALDEAVITLKAMQKSYFLRSQMKEVREEDEHNRQENGDRQPASEPE